MWISRVRLSAGASLFDERLGQVATEYGLHQWVWRLFPGDAEAARSFLYRMDQDPAGMLLYVVSQDQPQDGEGLFEVQSKPYEPKLRVGDLLQFSVRVNPVVTRHDETGAHKRHDVVMDVKHRAKADSSLAAGGAVSMIQDAVGAWLLKRCETLGFSFLPESILCEGYTQHVLRSGKRSHPVSFSTVDISGQLSVSDVDAFRKALFGGIGPAKGFGCGLMLVKRLP